MDKDRRTVFLILKEIEEKGTWSNLAADHLIRKEGADSPAFVRELVYGTLRNKTLLDFNIDRFLSKPKTGLSERIWLRMGFYQLALMDGVKDHAAINETVELARNFKKGSEGFINAVLRSFQRRNRLLIYPSEESESYLRVRYSVHKDIAKLWVDSFGPETAERLLDASNTPAPLAIRVNSLKSGRDELKAKLEELGFETSHEGTLSKNCLFVKGSGLLDTDLYKEGYFSVQGDSSQFAADLLSPKPGSRVIDLCAAPGGKSCAMAELMGDEGSILAFDLYDHRVKLIEIEAQRLGLNIVKPMQGDATFYDERLDSSADYVLADVPCSGLGTLRENPEIKFRTPDRINVQGKILENALRYVKAGGFVLYSTCTIDPKENEELIKSCAMLDSSILHGSAFDASKKYRVIASRQLFTKKGGHDGFYVCLIKRYR